MSAESASAVQRNQVDLLDFVDWSGVECLNQNTGHSVANALKQGYREDDGLNLESDADEQLLIYMPFTQVIKLHSIAIKGPEEEGPKTVKLFSNKEHMGFSNVNDFPPSDTVVFSPDDLKGKPVIVKYVKFQNVPLTIFIEDNQSGSDITKVQKVVLYGTTNDQVLNGSYAMLIDASCGHLCLSHTCSVIVTGWSKLVSQIRDCRAPKHYHTCIHTYIISVNHV
ncbi:hypothetical protein L1049_019646 [Liquidambar formosana]|uniref:PITH domain-containing protein n=1 Tax=Liquidambar formosana TaxID=63359 RepID=A0AAP0X6N9_LIQFO